MEAALDRWAKASIESLCLASLLLTLLACTLVACASPSSIAGYTSSHLTRSPAPSAGGDILVKVHVVTDTPPPGSGFELREGRPGRAEVYEFYLEDPGLPGSGEFRKVTSIRLRKLSDGEFYGEKRIASREGTLCVGYPSTNVIDGKACVEINQSKGEAEVTVHFWSTALGILR